MAKNYSALKKQINQSNIPEYPEFTKITLDHHELFARFANIYGHYSDFNFTSIFSWDTKDDAKVSIINNNLIISLPDYITGETLYSIIGDNDIDHSLEKLLRDVDKLKLVPEVVVNNIKNKDKFVVTEDKDNHDYIYSVKQLVDLPGGRYKNIRNKINNFINDYHGFTELEVSTTSILNIERYKSFHDVFYRWSRDKDLTDEEFELEKAAVNRLLENSHKLNLLIIEIQLANQLVAFSINEIVEPGYAITHFEKAIKIHQYFNAWVVKQVADILNDFGCITVNWEQDLGLLGLRRSKSSYRPIQMLNKYEVKLAK